MLRLNGRVSKAPSVQPSRSAPPRRSRAAAALVGAVMVAGALAGCASSAASTSVASPSLADFDGVLVTGAVGTPPAVQIGDGTQSTASFEYEDLVPGHGPAATATDRVTVEYVARSAKTKRLFDSSYARGKPFTYDPAKLGFSAFTQGVPGMKAGGRRVVIVPGPLAYGAAPPGWSGLGPNETLVFVIDLVSIDSP